MVTSKMDELVLVRAAHIGLPRHAMVAKGVPDWLFARSALGFIERHEAEVDQRYLQLCPYVVVFGPKSLEVLIYRRNGSEGRLHGKWSCGIGGHIHQRDLESDPVGAFYRGMDREISEEIGSDCLEGRMTQLGIVFDPTNPVGRVHLGVVFSLKLSDYPILPMGSEIHGARWVPLQDAKRISTSEPCESWMKLVLNQLL
jgi:predicted NUDIX family phosphoesterase